MIKTKSKYTHRYDDIAYAKENPIKGNVINYPNGENLYTGKNRSLLFMNLFFFVLLLH